MIPVAFPGIRLVFLVGGKLIPPLFKYSRNLMFRIHTFLHVSVIIWVLAITRVSNLDTSVKTKQTHKFKFEFNYVSILQHTPYGNNICSHIILIKHISSL